MSDVNAYPSRASVVLPAYLCAAAWALLLLWFGVLVLKVASDAAGFAWVPWAMLNAILYVLLAVAVFYLLTTIFARCTKCERLIFVEGFREKSPDFLRTAGLNYFSTTVVNVLRQRPFQCMYCGAKFKLEERHAS
jgi:hypothetical protein